MKETRLPAGSGAGRSTPRRLVRMALPLLAVPLLVGLAQPGEPPQAAPPPDPPEMIIHLLQRATFGPRPEEIAQAMESGMEGWLDAQMDISREVDPRLDRRLARHPGALMSPAEARGTFAPPRDVAELALLRERFQSGETLTPEERERLRTAAASGPGRLVLDLQAARLHRAVHSSRQLEEVMVGFWMDHFNVFVGKGQVRYHVADYEATAIRPHVFGDFEEMLQSVASHPAMLLYLDNARNVAPDTIRLRGLRGRGGPGTDRPLPGINENYARELLELHTLGVDGGYTEADVREVARVFTGWGVVPPSREGRGAGRVALRSRGEPGSFVFRPELHDGGRKTVLGRDLQGRGEGEGRELLSLLSRHPSTARTVATALATRFVADHPPASLVERLEAVFLETDGDLAEVTKTLFLSPEFHDPAHRGNRVRSPFLLATAALRLTGAELQDPRGILEHLRTMGELPYGAEPPTGFPQEAGGWGSSGAMVARIDFLSSLAAGEVRGVQLPPSSPLLEMGDNPLEELRALLLPWSTLGPGEDSFASGTEGGASPSDLRQALTLVLASPAFQTH